MHSIFAYLESLHPLAQLALLAAFFTSLGISLREVVSLFINMYRQWRERRKDEAIIAYLVVEVRSASHELNKYRQLKTQPYRSTAHRLQMRSE